MKTLQATTDKLAIGLSFACAVHCLALPLLLVSLPSLTALQLDNESFHRWMILAVLPSSLIALTLGCKQHKRYAFLGLGTAGLCLLVAAVVLGEDRIGEVGEKTMTLIGASFVALSHRLNFRRCSKENKSSCECSNDGLPSTQ